MRVTLLITKKEASPNAHYTIINNSPHSMLLDTLIPSTEKHIAKSASIYVYYSSIVKIGDFPFWE